MPTLVVIEWICVALVMLGLVPVVMALLQFLVVGLHGLYNHYDKCRNYAPRVAVVIPAWNEGAVIGATVDMLAGMNYPRDRLRLYIVDDASTDNTPEVCRAKALEYPGMVFPLRREKGGQGKAYTLNDGLDVVLAEPWAEAVMIMDADVLFERDALRRMARHLADANVGAVTAYIKEGSPHGNFISRSIAFEYITAQAAARRAQNVMGVMACLAGGAQLHSRQNLLALGGRIDTSSLAEDTFTTLTTELQNRRVVFESHATVWAEEPDSIDTLWKQRLRWARGNLQLTVAFRHVWFHIWRNSRVGGWFFGMMWFSVVLMPVFMILAAIGQVTLYFLEPLWAWRLIHEAWAFSFAAYLFVTVYSFVIDPSTARRAWLQGILFPGAISLAILVLAFLPWWTAHLAEWEMIVPHGHVRYGWLDAAMLFACSWTGLCMLAAWFVRRLELLGLDKRAVRTLVAIVGYGPLLCAVGIAALVAELRGQDRIWDKTEKSGKVRIQT